MVSVMTLLLFLAGCGKDNIESVDPSSSDESDDYIANVDFDLTITVDFSSSGATVSGASDAFTVDVSGNDVTITNTGSDIAYYELSGTASDGYFKLYSEAKQALKLDGLDLTNGNGAAINIQSGKTTFVVLSGSNSLADGNSYTNTPEEEDEKAAFFSEGQLVFSGDGDLSVNATGKHGICSDDYLRILEGPTLNVTTSANMRKGLKANDYIRIDGGTTTVTVTGGTAYDDEDAEYKGTAGVKTDGNFIINGGSLSITNSGTGGKGISADADGYFNGGTVNISVTGSNYGSSGSGGGMPGSGSSTSDGVSSKGIKMDGNLTFTGGTITVSSNSHEGIEAKGTIKISGGEIYSYSSDDAINSGGEFTITGGTVCAYSSGNDGLDANGDFIISGGLIYAIVTTSPELGIDVNSEGGYSLTFSGGTLIAVGGLESGSTLSQSCYSASSWSSNTWYGMTVGSNTYAFKTPSSGGTPLVVSGSSQPSLVSGVTVSGGTSCCNNMINTGASLSGGSSVTLSSYSGGNTGGGGGGNGPGGGGPF